MNDNVEERDLHGAGAAGGYAGVAPQPAFPLDEDERLPWLESADDDDDVGAVDTGRLLRFMAIAVALLAAILGGLWYVNHRAGGKPVPDGGVIKAPSEPYKTEPTDKGGKTFAGTGDSAYAVSEGKSTQAKLAGSDSPAAARPAAVASPSVTPNAAPTGKASPKAAASDASAAAVDGVGVQVGAYSSTKAAEAGWTRLSAANGALKGVRHRIVEGSADIGTVYRLQAVTGDVATANALCSELKGAGVACQVKR
ncbi:MAG TPA: SPOR domain-containing protein [Novosphingobium sp.]